MQALCADMGVSPHRFKLEITETGLMTSPEQAVSTLKQLVNAGCSIAIDDFGIGYSSLSYLKTLPAETIKIDQSFIKNLLNSPEDQALVKAVISMSHSLGKQVTAEGVETREQLAFLNQFACNKAQGYLFSKPLTPEAVLQKYANKITS